MDTKKAEQDNMYTRTEMMLGSEGVGALSRAHVAVFGIGGVGGYATEALVRAGVGELTLVDSDRVSASNINRQIIATSETVGRYKTDVAAERAREINPCVRINTRRMFFSDENVGELDFKQFDYVIDAIDSVRSKLLLIRTAVECGTPIISSMGAGNKLDPTRFRVTDISKTFADPLAKVIRTELRRSGINHLRVVFSDEPPYLSTKGAPGSLSFVPSVAGLILAGEVIKDIALKKSE